MWAPLIFLILGQAYLLSADPVPKVEEPHNALWWIKQEVIASDTSPELLWLRKLLVSNPEAATSWIRNTLNVTRHVVSLLEIWFGEYSELVEDLREQMAIESWYTDQALNPDQDAETWERLKAGRNDTEFAIRELRETFSNDSLILTLAIRELEFKEYEHSELIAKVIGISAAAALSEENDSVVHNALWWVKQAILTDTSDDTQWLRTELLENPETGSTLVKEALRNTRDTVAAVTQAVGRWPTLTTKLAQNTENELWYINQALEEDQDADTWYQLKSKRDDTEEAFAWIRATVTNSTLDALSWFQGLAKNQPGEAAMYLRIILVGDSASQEVDSATEGPPFWLKLDAARTKYDHFTPVCKYMKTLYTFFPNSVFI